MICDDNHGHCCKAESRELEGAHLVSQVDGEGQSSGAEELVDKDMLEVTIFKF